MTINGRLARLGKVVSSGKKFRWYQNTDILVMVALYLNQFGVDCETITDDFFASTTEIINKHTCTWQENVKIEAQLREFCTKFGIDAGENVPFAAASILATIIQNNKGE